MIIKYFFHEIMEYLGPSIKKLFYQCNNKFDVATVANLAIQCLYRLEDIHNAGYLHQDIKPENLTIGDMDSDRKHSNKFYNNNKN